MGFVKHYVCKQSLDYPELAMNLRIFGVLILGYQPENANVARFLESSDQSNILLKNVVLYKPC